jgi:4-hydroxy-3-methylbut-2-en-1-yl diphosphate synthase IspG/GcpE
MHQTRNRGSINSAAQAPVTTTVKQYKKLNRANKNIMRFLCSEFALSWAGTTQVPSLDCHTIQITLFISAPMTANIHFEELHL